MQITDRLLTMGVVHGRSGRKMTPQGIVIHYVGNPGSSAEGNRNWFNNGGTGASAHYIVGLNGEILRCLPDDEQGAHAGRSYGAAWNAMATTNNSRFIGIENCHPKADGQFNTLTNNALIWLCVDLCKKWNLNPANDIYRHYDVTGKSCPLFHTNYPQEWSRLKNDIVSAFRNSSVQNTQSSSQEQEFREYRTRVTADKLNIRSGPGVNFASVGTIADKGTYTVAEEAPGAGANRWGRLKSGAGWISLDFTQRVI